MNTITSIFTDLIIDFYKFNLVGDNSLINKDELKELEEIISAISTGKITSKELLNEILEYTKLDFTNDFNIDFNLLLIKFIIHGMVNDKNISDLHKNELCEYLLNPNIKHEKELISEIKINIALTNSLEKYNKNITIYDHILSKLSEGFISIYSKN